MKIRCTIQAVMIVLSVFLATFAAARTTRIKDIANIKGVRSNALVGYGLVIGLAGTGDTEAHLTSKRAVVQLLSRLGIESKVDEIVPGSYAMVIVTAELPSFAKNGSKLDVRLSANGDATSLQGGTLLQSALTGTDGNVYALASGPVVLGTEDGSGVATVGIVPGGGVVERELEPIYYRDGLVSLSLNDSDFTTNHRVVNAINAHFKGFFAKSLSPMTIEVTVPEHYQERLVQFMSELENLKVSIESKAVVVLNQQTGTVVLGNQVTIGPVTIAHGNLSIKVAEGDDTRTETLATAEGPTVGELVKLLNSLGVSPKDLAGILQSINAAGALYGEVKFL